MALSLLLVLVAGATGAEKATDSKPANPGGMCAEMMQRASPEGQTAMREFMQSERAPLAMATMTEMARRMGNGDVMLGMTWMMEMMGSMGGGGTMGGRGRMMPPGGTHPGK